MEWRRAWYDGSLRPIDWIEVDEAIELRNRGSTKAGDTFCCECKQIRISPVDAKVRRRHFRRHRKSPDEIHSRKQCEEIRKSRQQGENWKHTQIVAEIMHYLQNGDGKKIHHVSEVEKAGGVHRDQADLIVTHSRQVPHFETTEVRILVRMWNWRRQRDLLENYPNSIVIQAHRWQRSQITDDGFVDLIRKNVDEAYEMDANARYKFYTSSNHTTYIPNFGYWDFELRKSNKQRKIEIPSAEQKTDIVSELKSLDDLVDRVREHNLWAISHEGMEQYHLKYLQFRDYQGTGYHEDPTIDAVLSHAEEFCDSAYDIHNIDLFRKINRWRLNGVGEFWVLPMDVMKIASAPGLWDWSDLNLTQMKKCLNYIKNQYRDQTYQKLPNGQSVPMVMTPLVNISSNNLPQILDDVNGIEKFITDYIRTGDMNPLTPEELKKLQFYVSANKWMNNLFPRHPIYESLLHDRIHYAE